MTATLPEVRRMELENLGLELYPRDRSELKALAEEEERPRYYIQTCDRTTAMQKAIEAYRDGKRVLWVVNTVDRCQKTARELDEKLEGDSANVLCYHSRFKLVHRNQRHKEVVEAFKQSEKRAIAVTTQVCEMSLDLDADVLITELAPCSALVQRFGRSNRHGKLKYSEIFVYEPETEKPYTEELLDRAREFLTTVTNAQPHASQKLLAEQLEIYGERETLADGNAPFLTGGYFACSEPFRNIDNWTHDCVLEEDVKAAIERIEAKDAKWHELVLPVPNYVETQKPNDSQAKCLKYLRIAPSSKYCNKVGFQA
jgi:CRISPR-associated endonuclease/helicase Cas3